MFTREITFTACDRRRCDGHVQTEAAAVQGTLLSDDALSEDMQARDQEFDYRRRPGQYWQHHHNE